LQGSWSAGNSVEKLGSGQLTVNQFLPARAQVQAGRLILAAGASGEVSVAAGAQLQVEASVGSLINRGSVDVGAGSLQVGGVLVNHPGAVINLVQASSGQVPLRVSGQATLDGALTYRVARASLSAAHAASSGSISVPLIALGTPGQVSFSRIETDQAPSGYTLTPTQSTSGLSVEIARRDFSQTVTSQAGKSVAEVLNGLRSVTVSPGISRAIEQISAAPAATVEALLPRLTSHASLGNSVAQSQMGQQFSREAQSLGFGASDAAPASSLMPRLSHNSGAQASGARWWASAPVWRSRFESAGLSQRLGYQGVSVGTDTVISAGGDRLGLSVSVIEQSSQSDDFQSKGSYRQASFYGLSPLGAFKASYSVGIGRGSSEQTRWIRLPEQAAVSARANPQDNHVQASAGLSYAFDLAAQVKMEPFVRLGWRMQERSGYTETGADDLGLQVSEHRGYSHATSMGWRWSGKASGWSSRDLHWATHWEWSRHSDRYPVVEQRFVNTSAAFTTPGMDGESSASMVSVSLRQVLSKGAEVGLSLGADRFQGRLGRALTLSYRNAW
jgi:hypothetical protein